MPCTRSARASSAATRRRPTRRRKASLDGEVTIGAFDTADWVQYNCQPAVNNSSTVTWKTKLKPGEKFEPSVSYHYFTRH